MPPEKNRPKDDVDPDDEDLDRDPEDDEDEDDPEDDFEPPKTKAELEAMIKAAGNAEAKRWRLRAMGRDPKWKGPGRTDPPEDKKPEDGKKDGQRTEAEIEAAVRTKIQAEFDQKAQDQNLRASVATALLTAGLNLSDEEAKSPEKARKAVQRVVGMMDLQHMSLEDDGAVSGLDDEIADLRKTYPGLFKSGTGGGRTTKPGGDSAPRRGGPGGEKDPLEQMAEAFLGKSG